MPMTSLAKAVPRKGLTSALRKAPGSERARGERASIARFPISWRKRKRISSGLRTIRGEAPAENRNPFHEERAMMGCDAGEGRYREIDGCGKEAGGDQFAPGAARQDGPLERDCSREC